MSQAPSLTPPILAMPKGTIQVPDSLRQLESDPRSFQLRLFTYGQEIDSMTAARVTGASLDYELLQRCIILFDGKPVDQGENVLERTSPGVRLLMVRALNKLTGASDPKVIEDAVEGMVIEV